MYKKIMAERWMTPIIGIPHTNVARLVLWRYSFIPARIPQAPPSQARRNSLRSDMRDARLAALRLSARMTHTLSALIKT